MPVDNKIFPDRSWEDYWGFDYENMMMIECGVPSEPFTNFTAVRLDKGIRRNSNTTRWSTKNKILTGIKSMVAEVGLTYGKDVFIRDLERFEILVHKSQEDKLSMIILIWPIWADRIFG